MLELIRIHNIEEIIIKTPLALSLSHDRSSSSITHNTTRDVIIGKFFGNNNKHTGRCLHHHHNTKREILTEWERRRSHNKSFQIDPISLLPADSGSLGSRSDSGAMELFLGQPVLPIDSQASFARVCHTRFRFVFSVLRFHAFTDFDVRTLSTIFLEWNANANANARRAIHSAFCCCSNWALLHWVCQLDSMWPAFYVWLEYRVSMSN